MPKTSIVAEESPSEHDSTLEDANDYVPEELRSDQNDDPDKLVNDLVSKVTLTDKELNGGEDPVSLAQ